MAVKEVEKKYWSGIGRRKTAVASVRIFEYDKTITINDSKSDLPESVMSIFELVGKKGSFGLSVKMNGGGIESRLDAIKLGIARALEKFDAELHTTLKKAGYLTRDPREKERKKPGLRGARRAPQWAKR
jgi:small subunit ribosomal protein S9